MNLEEQLKVVKRSLVQFVSTHIPEADFSVIDDIVLTYITSVMEDASQDPCFDVDSFTEMLTPYFSDFSSIDSTLICEWIFQLEHELLAMQSDAPTAPINISFSSLKLSDIISESKLCARPSSVSEKNELLLECNKLSPHTSETSDFGSIESSICDHYPEELEALQEMFPEASNAEIKHCISIAKGDIDSATQILLHRQEIGQSLSDKTTLSNRKNSTVNDIELKNRIIARYSYVDKNAAQRDYKPVVQKNEPKKLVRYRDNKIVSLKGERYTEIKRDGDIELKKSKKTPNPQLNY